MPLRGLVYGPELPEAARPAGAAIFPNALAALEALENEPAESVLLCATELAQAGLPALPPEVADYDLLHAGLRLGAEQLMHSLWLTGTNWLFLDPHPDRRAVSWKALPALCWLRPATVRDLGGFDLAYQSAEARLMDLAYRLLAAGGRVCHDPFGLPAPGAGQPALALPLADELVFVFRHLGAAAAGYVTFWQGLLSRRPWAAWQAWRAARQRVRACPALKPQAGRSLRLMAETKRQVVGTISAIIPTLNRYECMARSIQSLLQQTPAPTEIIVVDQTPPEARQPEVYAPFLERSQIRVIYLEQAGQSLARNAAIQAAVGEWCLLFEDDAAAWEDMLAQHVAAVERSGAAVSTGISLAPWKDASYIPANNRHFQLTEVLATGNSLAKRAALLAVDGLDRAYDRGSGADHDLGVRLHLAGYEVLLNPKAIMTHYKAPHGGMRTYGAWWRTHATFWAPYPQATQVYTIQRYYPHTYWLPLYLLYYMNARRQLSKPAFVWLWVSAPWKLTRAIRAAAALKTQFAGWRGETQSG
jgi:GT2 family glycosyltransferase